MAERKGAAVTIQVTSKSSPVRGGFSDPKLTIEAANETNLIGNDDFRGKSRSNAPVTTTTTTTTTTADDDDDDKGTGRQEEAGRKSAGWKSVGGWSNGRTTSVKQIHSVSQFGQTRRAKRGIPV